MAVYFIGRGESGPVKIGHAKNVKKRRKSLQTGSPEKLIIIAKAEGGADIESWIHSDLEEFRINGEWFRRSRDVLDYAENLEENVSSIKSKMKEQARVHTGNMAYILKDLLMACEIKPREWASLVGVAENSVYRKLRGELGYRGEAEALIYALIAFKNGGGDVKKFLEAGAELRDGD